MNKFKSYVLSAIGLLALLAMASLINTGRAGAQGERPPQPVRVVNTPSDWFAVGPVFVTDVNNPAAQPFQEAVTWSFIQGFNNQGEPIATVPSGKRLVIEHVSLTCVLSLPNQKLVDANIVTKVNGKALQHQLVVNGQGADSSFDYFAASQPVRLYADPDTTVFVGAIRNTTQGGSSLTFSISGYLVDMPKPIEVIR